MLILELPLPHKSLSPNARTHWAGKARATKAARNTARLICLEAMGHSPAPRWPAGTFVVRWYSKTAMRPDEDNAKASLKAYKDGIVDAGYLSTDKDLRCIGFVFGKDKARPRVELEVCGAEHG